ncbi:hypothetical protein BDZ89DRAFT_1036673 [Hymenopellis radicata]|nr:hypothetical protein BDZ89DRAFT_1036673 [Hymenopellis radicata]
MNRSRGPAIHDARWKKIKSDALNGFLPALQACCTALVRLDSKSPQANALFVELHDVLRVNFRVEDAPSDPTGVYDFLDTNHERLRAVSYCMDILLFGISTTDERGSAPIVETRWWTPILLGMGVDEHIKFIHAVDAVCFLLNGRSQKIKALRKSTPDLVLPLVYAFLSLEPSPLCKLNAISAMQNLVREYVTPTYREGAAFNPSSLVEGAASEVAGSFLSCLRRAVDNRSRIDYAMLFGHAAVLNMISESESYVQVGRHLSALQTTHLITRLLRIVGTECNRTQYLARTSFSSGVRGVRCAMSARLLDALVSLHGLARHDETSDGLRDALLLVTKFAQHYLVFRSFIALSSKSLRSIEDRRLLVDNPGAELVDSFLVLLRDRIMRLKEQMDQMIYVCQSPQSVGDRGVLGPEPVDYAIARLGTRVSLLTTTIDS